MTELVLRGARIAYNDRIVDDGWIAIDNGRITECGSGPRTSGTDIRGRLLTAGLVDIHVHGGAGVSFADVGDSSARAAIEFHRRRGTTSLVAGIASAPWTRMAAAAAAAAEWAVSGELEGTFFEGPYLSPARKGAHRPEDLRTPVISTADDLIQAGAGFLAMVAVAPEIPGGLELVKQLTAHGVHVALGHTDASYEVARAGFDAGARIATHLFNGMRPIHHRDPGVIVAALDNDDVTCELIADGFHVDDVLVSRAFHVAGAHRIALVTDAVAAAGLPDGVYGDGERQFEISGGRSMLADGSSLAGSTLTLDAAVRRLVGGGHVHILDALRSATATPAAALGMADEVGSIAPGLRADFAVFGDDLNPLAVMRRGAWVSGPWRGERVV